MPVACVFVLLLMATMAVRGLLTSIRATGGVQLVKGGITRAVGPSLQKAGPSTRLFMSTEAGGEDTVVSRCTQKIQDALNPVKLVVQAAHDDPNGSHIAVEVVSKEFEGQRTAQRQRLVYKAIWDEMADGGAVHAVDQIIAKTPEEAGM